jgi:hypothetical protein
MTSNNPATDPSVDIEIGDDYHEPVTYFTNAELNRMTALARQVAGVVLVTEDEEKVQQGGEGEGAAAVESLLYTSCFTQEGLFESSD